MSWIVLPEGGIYSKYLIGEIHADFLDTDDREDIATSGRQRIIEDDPRYQSLLQFLQKELKNIQNQWTTLRNAKGEKVALEVPAVKEMRLRAKAQLTKPAPGPSSAKSISSLSQVNLIESVCSSTASSPLRVSGIATTFRLLMPSRPRISTRSR